MPRLLSLLIVVAVLLGLAPTAYAAPAQQATSNPFYLQSVGTKLYWGGKEIILKGTNFDNIGALGAGIGTNNVNDVDFVNADYATVASHGANHVRLGLSFSWYQQNKTAFFAMLDQQIGFARANGIFILLNMFTTPGNCYEGYGNICPFWGNPGEHDQLAAFWKDVAGRYKNEPALAGYDILNEPTPANGCSTWFNIARNKIIPAIREVDTNHLIFVMTCSDPGNDLEYNNPPKGANIVWQVHNYFPMDFSHDNFTPGSVYPGTAKEWFGSCYVDKNEMAGVTKNCGGYGDVRQNYGKYCADRNNMPWYVGEWGSTSRLNGYVQYNRDVAELFRDWSVSHAHYTWKHQTIVSGGFHQWGITSVHGGVIDDMDKLNAVKVSWTGSVKPNFSTGGTSPTQQLPTLTPSLTPTNTLTPTRTNTPGPGTPTNTPVPPTNTLVPTPSNTPTRTATATNTATAAPPTLTPGAPTTTTTFFKGVNVGGAGRTVDSNAWVGQTAAGVTVNGSTQSNSFMTLNPTPSDAGVVAMLKDWKQYWAFSASIASVPAGQYQVYVYTVQDYDASSANPVTFTAEGAVVGSYTAPTGAGAAGRWDKLGPWLVTVNDGTLNIAASDLVNVAGIEVFSLVQPTATPTFTPIPTNTNTPAPATATNTPTRVPVPPAGSASFTLSVSVDGQNRVIDITTTGTGLVSIVLDPPPADPAATNTVGGCWNQLGSVVCLGSQAGTIQVVVPGDTKLVNVTQANGNGYRVWVAP